MVNRILDGVVLCNQIDQPEMVSTSISTTDFVPIESTSFCLLVVHNADAAYNLIYRDLPPFLKISDPLLSRSHNRSDLVCNTGAYRPHGFQPCHLIFDCWFS